MTKCEIRKAVMNEARIEEDSIVLDVGAGTGSISIEAALAAPKGHVYAIERFDKGIDLINENMKKFNVNNMTVIKSKAPEGMEELPELDAVIIGGSAGGMTGIMDEAQRLLKSRRSSSGNCSNDGNWLYNLKRIERSSFHL